MAPIAEAQAAAAVSVHVHGRVAASALSQSRVLPWPLETVWPTAVRYLRVDRGYAIVDRFLNGDRARIDALTSHADGADQARELFLPWTPSEDMRWRPFVPPPVNS